MSGFLLDTDIAIELTRKRDQNLRARAAAESGLALSAVTVFELRFGADNSVDPSANHAGVDELIGIIEPISFDARAARHAGHIRLALQRRGIPIGAYDTLIAGHARSLGMTLVTRNVREFERVPGLLVEVW